MERRVTDLEDIVGELQDEVRSLRGELRRVRRVVGEPFLEGPQAAGRGGEDRDRAESDRGSVGSYSLVLGWILKLDGIRPAWIAGLRLLAVLSHLLLLHCRALRWGLRVGGAVWLGLRGRAFAVTSPPFWSALWVARQGALAAEIGSIFLLGFGWCAGTSRVRTTTRSASSRSSPFAKIWWNEVPTAESRCSLDSPVKGRPGLLLGSWPADYNWGDGWTAWACGGSRSGGGSSPCWRWGLARIRLPNMQAYYAVGIDGGVHLCSCGGWEAFDDLPGGCLAQEGAQEATASRCLAEADSGGAGMLLFDGPEPVGSGCDYEGLDGLRDGCFRGSPDLCGVRRRIRHSFCRGGGSNASSLVGGNIRGCQGSLRLHDSREWIGCYACRGSSRRRWFGRLNLAGEQVGGSAGWFGEQGGFHCSDDGEQEPFSKASSENQPKAKGGRARFFGLSLSRVGSFGGGCSNQCRCGRRLTSGDAADGGHEEGRREEIDAAGSAGKDSSLECQCFVGVGGRGQRGGPSRGRRFWVSRTCGPYGGLPWEAQILEVLAGDKLKHQKRSKIASGPGEGAAVGGVKKAAAARRALRQALLDTPEEVSAMLERLMLEDLTSQTMTPGSPTVQLNEWQGLVGTSESDRGLQDECSCVREFSTTWLLVGFLMPEPGQGSSSWCWIRRR